MGLVLGLRSWYSKTGGFLSPAAAVCAAKGQGAQAVAFADVNELGGTLEWLEACEKNQVMPIAGIEVGLNDQDEVRQALLFARGRDGMQRLFAVVSAADSDGDGLITTPEEGAWKNLVFCS